MTTRLTLVAIFGVAMAACDSAPPADSELCAENTGGALITFEVATETFTGWFTDADFIAEAKALAAAGETRVPVFEEVIAGASCDAQWNFRVDPSAVHFADATIELCDGRPSYIDENLTDWLEQVGSWCPWGAEVVSVVEQP